MSIQGLYISDHALRQAHALCEEARSGDPAALRSPATAAAGPSEWTDFDAAYLWLLRLALTGGAAPGPASAEIRDRLIGPYTHVGRRPEDQAVRVDFLLHLELMQGGEKGFISEQGV